MMQCREAAVADVEGCVDGLSRWMMVLLTVGIPHEGEHLLLTLPCLCGTMGDKVHGAICG